MPAILYRDFCLCKCSTRAVKQRRKKSGMRSLVSSSSLSLFPKGLPKGENAGGKVSISSFMCVARLFSVEAARFHSVQHATPYPLSGMVVACFWHRRCWEAPSCMQSAMWRQEQQVRYRDRCRHAWRQECEGSKAPRPSCAGTRRSSRCA